MLGGLAVLVIAVIMVVIAMWFIMKSKHTAVETAPSWVDSQLDNDPFSATRRTSLLMPKFSGSVM